VRLKVDVPEGRRDRYRAPAPQAANQTTSTIPIVFAVTGDPVGT
jgi:hypothetical protein